MNPSKFLIFTNLADYTAKLYKSGAFIEAWLSMQSYIFNEIIEYNMINGKPVHLEKND